MTPTSMLWLFPLIAAGGVLQAMGGPMNNALRVSLVNPWLATLVSFGLIVPIFLVIAAVFVRPLPTVAGIAGMPWWHRWAESSGPSRWSAACCSSARSEPAPTPR